MESYIPEAPKDKVYLYHMVPDDMRGNEIRPRKKLEGMYPDVYERVSRKYDGRQAVAETFIDSLNSHWDEVVHLSPIKPADLRAALLEAGFKPIEMKFYEIDPELLTSENTTIFLNEDTSTETSTKDENFLQYDSSNVSAYATIREATRRYYRQSKEAGNRPFLFVGIPHILYKGSIDISKVRVITV